MGGMDHVVLVVGAGGLGGVTAARLLRAGHAVDVLVRPGPIADALAADGLQLEEGGRRTRFRPTVLGDVDRARPYGLVVLATQPPDVEEAAAQVGAALAIDGAAIVLQNGLCEERVARVFGQDRVIGGVVAFGAEQVAPGIVRATSQGGITLGASSARVPVPAMARAEQVLASVAPVARTSNLRGSRWTKLAFNCAISTLGTLGGDRVGPLVRRPLVRRLALEILTECVWVAAAEEVRLEPLAGFLSLDRLALTAAERDHRWHPGWAWRHAALLGVGVKIRHLRSSMLRALEAGRPPAVDFLNGEIVAAAARHGLHVPVNARAQALVHAAARGERTLGVPLLEELYETTRGIDGVVLRPPMSSGSDRPGAGR